MNEIKEICCQEEINGFMLSVTNLVSYFPCCSLGISVIRDLLEIIHHLCKLGVG